MLSSRLPRREILRIARRDRQSLAQEIAPPPSRQSKAELHRRARKETKQAHPPGHEEAQGPRE